MIPPPPRSTLFPYTTLFRSDGIYAFAFGDFAGFFHRIRSGVGGCRPSAHRGRRNLQRQDRKSTRLNSSHTVISYAVFCLKKKKKKENKNKQVMQEMQECNYD